MPSAYFGSELTTVRPATMLIVCTFVLHRQRRMVYLWADQCLWLLWSVIRFWFGNLTVHCCRHLAFPPLCFYNCYYVLQYNIFEIDLYSYLYLYLCLYLYLYLHLRLYLCLCLYRVSHELRSLLRESVPYVKIYRYNPKHLYPKLNGYGDNGQRSLKVWQLLHTYWLPNWYWNWQEYMVSVMLISVLNIKVTCEWHKAIKLNYKNIRTRVIVILRVRSTIHDTGMPNADVT